MKYLERGIKVGRDETEVGIAKSESSDVIVRLIKEIEIKVGEI